MKKSVRYIAVLLSILAVVTLCGGCSVKNYRVEIVVEDYGSIILQLDGKTAPKTVKNFVKLVKEGFYDGLSFFRIVPGFMIQGGSPTGDSTGASEEYIKGEFAANGHKNSISHRPGVISMARAQESYDSASCQFFIVTGDATSLNGQYAAFGEVVEGMDVVYAMEAAAQEKGYLEFLAPEEQIIIREIKIIG